MQRTITIVCLSFLALFTFVSLHADDPIDPTAGPLSHHPQLFLDDVLIAEMKNVRREMQQPARHPKNPLIKPDFPWENRMIEFYGSVLFDERLEKFRCWYLASESPDANPEYYICYAESRDGIEWQKPFVGEGKFGPYDRHNIVLRGGHGISVMETPGDPDPARRFKGVGGDFFAWSPDGLHWTTENCRAAIGKNDTSPSFVHWKGEYLYYVRNQEPETGKKVFDSISGKTWSGTMRGVGLSVSKDFRSWTPKRSILRGDERDRFPWGQPHALCATVYGDVLIGLLPMLALNPEDDNNFTGTMNVQLATSRDGRNWHRVANRAVFMAEDNPGPLEQRNWDAHFHPGSPMLVKDDLVYIYYFGCKFFHGEARKNPNHEITGPRPFGIGLATLPADRFVSLRPDNAEQEAVVQTRPLRLSGKDLLVNADLGADHAADSLRVELRDAKGNPLPGFGAAASVLVRHDKLRHRIVWRTAAEERSLANAPLDQPIAVRFTLRHGKLFAFQLAR
jgi:hypothetical protein